MYLCYLDESGTPEIPGTTSHYVLAGLAVPIWHWRDCDANVATIRRRYGLEDNELHTAWILRAYPEQNTITDFAAMTYFERRQKIEQYRRAELLRLQRSPNHKLYKQVKKNYRHTDSYIHLTHGDRSALIHEIARAIAGWGFARLFVECIDKINYVATKRTVDEEALEQVVSRFEHYLRAISASTAHPALALLIHDNNETVAKKHTKLMQQFHRKGTLWTDVKHIMETPLFVNSELTSMVQVVDLCAYAFRRYLENGEESLFDVIFQRADRRGDRVVGARHFSPRGCACKICLAHGRED